MMRKVELQTRAESFLATFRLPEITFDCSNLPFSSLVPIWEAMRIGQHETARTEARTAMEQRRIFHPEERAAMEMALAEAERRLGATDMAKRMAGRSLDLYPNQLASHQVLLSVLIGRKDFLAAYMHLANLAVGDTLTLWDTPVSEQDTYTALASWAWQLGEWDQVADHLLTAFPEGVTSMPAGLREDYFRLALYRGNADDASTAAAAIIADQPTHMADEILQTIVQSGWAAQALPLYESIFVNRPQDELLRRRLVALNIKQGNIEEARRLTRPGALRLAA